VRRRVALVVLPALLAAGCGGEAPRGDPAAGESLATDVVEPSCDRCHALAEAGWAGTIGPSLDDLRPGYQRVLDAIREGPGLMPAYDHQLGEGELQDLAAYVSGAASP
jgi:sulfite dehydrogenase